MNDAAMQWLRQEGADWPNVLRYAGTQWPEASIAWCRAEGCDSPLELELEDVDTDNGGDENDEIHNQA
jgi:hypothetical protein